MDYPSGFPAEFIGRVESARDAAELRFQKALANGSSRSVLLALRYAAEVLGAFGREACEARRLEIIGPSELRLWVDQFVEALGSHTYDVCGVESVVRQNFQDPMAAENWFRRHLVSEIRNSPEWTEHLEDRLRTTATTSEFTKPSQAQILFRRKTLRRFKEEHEITDHAIAKEIHSTVSAYYAIVRGVIEHDMPKMLSFDCSN